MAAATGTLMAAALETSGYKGLSIVLAELGVMIGGMGALIYMTCAISAIISVSLMGNYRAAVWFLVGPGLFWWLIDPQVNSSGAEWQYGKTKSQKEVLDVLGAKDSVNAKVPWLFDAYNQLISDLIQSFIGVVTNGDLAKQIKFMSRQRIMDRLFRAELDNPGLLALIHRGIKGACAKEMNNARMIALGNRESEWFTDMNNGSPEYRAAIGEYVSDIKRYDITLDANTPEYNYLYDLFNAVRIEQSKNNFDLNCNSDRTDSNLDIDFTKDGFTPEEVLHRPVSCRQLWCWTGIGLAKEAGQLQKDAEKKYIAKYADGKEEYKNIYEEIWNEIAVKLLPTTVDTSHGTDVSVIPIVVGGILLRKTLLSDTRSGTYQELANHSGVYTRPYNFSVKMTKDQVNDFTQQSHKHTMAQSQRYEMFIFAQVIPYLQGIFLYALAITFPFFALLVVIPGKAMSFFSWFAIWTWVKSWDLGYAIVYVIDDFWWDLMPHSSVYNPDQDTNHGPISILEMAFQHDPAYHLSHYYMIIGVLISAVPVLAAKLVLGSKQAMAGMLVNGLKSMSQKLSGSVANRVAHDQVMRTDYIREKFLRDYVNQRLHQDANSSVTRAKAEADKSTGWGKALKWAGIGALGVAAGVGIAALTIGSGGLLGMAVAGAAAAYYMHGTGINMLRSANNARAKILSSNAELHYFNATQTPEFYTMNAIRSGLSGRGEFWNQTDAPKDAAAALKATEMHLKRQRWSEAARAAANDVVVGVRKFFGF